MKDRGKDVPQPGSFRNEPVARDRHPAARVLARILLQPRGLPVECLHVTIVLSSEQTVHRLRSFRHERNTEADEGEAVETIPAEYDGEEITIGFNSDYLLDYYRLFQNGTAIKMELKDGNSQIRMEPAEPTAAAPV